MNTAAVAPQRRRRAIVTLALLAAVATAGCGSLVPLEETSPQAGNGFVLPSPGADGLGQPGLAAPTVPGVVGGNGAVGGTGGTGGTGGAVGTVGTPGATAGGGGTGAGTGGTGGGTGGTGGSATPTASAVPVVTGPLKVGLLYVTGSDAIFSALGLGALTTGDTKAQGTAIANYLNGHGGVAGRKVDLKLAPINFQDALNNQASALQAACSQLTQDDKVAFVISYLALMPGTMACFAKAGVGVINDAAGLTDEVMNQYGAQFAAPGDIGPGRLMSVLVDSLWRSGWLTKSSKVGVLGYDDDRSTQITNGPLKQALAAKGLSIATYQQISNTTSGITQASAAVLKYRSAKVDRIIPVFANPLFLMQGAQSQGYKPRYALYSTFAPGALLESSAPRTQLIGSAGIGWSPNMDIGKGVRPGAVSSNATLCSSIMEGAGQRPKGGPQAAFQSQLCNAFFYLAFAAKKVGGAPADLLVRARSAVKGSFSPADTFKSDVSRRPDGVAAYRELSFVEGCKCFQYGATRTTS